MATFKLISSEVKVEFAIGETDFDVMWNIVEEGDDVAEYKNENTETIKKEEQNEKVDSDSDAANDQSTSNEDISDEDSDSSNVSSVSATKDDTKDEVLVYQNTRKFTFKLGEGKRSLELTMSKSLNSTIFSKSFEGLLSEAEDFFKNWMKTVDQALWSKLVDAGLVNDMSCGLEVYGQALMEIGINELAEIVEHFELNESVEQSVDDDSDDGNDE